MQIQSRLIVLTQTADLTNAQMWKEQSHICPPVTAPGWHRRTNLECSVNAVTHVCLLSEVNSVSTCSVE